MGKLKNAWAKSKFQIEKNSPEILTGVACGSIFGVGILAFRAGVKSADVIKQNREDLEVARRYKDNKAEEREIIFDTVKTVAVNSAPAVVCGAAGMTAAIASNRIQNKRIGVLAAGLAMAERTIKEHEDALRDLGSDITHKVKTEEAEQHLKKEPMPETDKEKWDADYAATGLYPCKLKETNQVFLSNSVKVKEAILALSNRFVGGSDWESVNGFCDLLGIDRAGPRFDDFGWNDTDVVKYQTTIGLAVSLPIWTESVLDDNGNPILVVSMDTFINHDTLERYWHGHNRQYY